MKLSTGVLVVLLGAIILLPAESALAYALKGFAFISCAIALVRQSGQPRLNSLYVFAGVLSGALVAIFALV
jgi:hypothetical protein